MARRRFRIESLPKEQREQLRIFADQYFPGPLKQKFIDSIEKSGTISPELFDEGGFNEKDRAFVSQEVGRIAQGLPQAKDAYSQFIQSQGAEADLTDEELRDRVEAYQGLGGSTGRLDRDELRRELAQSLNASAAQVETEGKDPLTTTIADWIMANNRYPSSTELSSIIGGIKEKRNVVNQETKKSESKEFPIKVSAELQNFINNQAVRNKFSDFVARKLTPPETAEDVKRIQDILSERGAVSAKEGELKKFLVETPPELRSERVSGLVERQGRSENFLAERYGPRVLAELNALGLAEGPDVASLIAAKAGDLQGANEEIFRQQEAQDNAFFAEAAYRLNTAKLEMSQSAFRSSVEGERALIRQGQGQRFESGQKDLQREFELSLLDREANRNLNLKRQGLQVGEKESSDALTSGLVNDAASSTAQIVAGKVVYGAKGESGKTQPSPSFRRLG